jgi:predicted phosphoribosyltransferase
MVFSNRHDAAQQIIPLLGKYKNEDAVVLAVPRGGVPIGYCIAVHYGFPLELLMTKKIGHPGNKELAIGSVSLEGYLVDERHRIPQTYIEKEIKDIRESLQRRHEKFTGKRAAISIFNKTLIITDDGIATGYTLLAAIHMLRKKHSGKIVIAVPVAPADTVQLIRKDADDLICLHIAEDFYGVGQYYKDFSEVTDDEVMKLIRDADAIQHTNKL